MRLGNFTAVELALRPSNPHEAVTDYRVVGYVPEQDRPVYISEARRPDMVGDRAIAKFNSIRFDNSTLHRSFRLALQLWVNKETWTIREKWIIDLRHLRRPNNSAFEPIILHSKNGPLVPAIPMQEVQPTVQDTIPGSESTGLSPKPPSQARSFRLFGWGSTNSEDSISSASPPEPGALVSLSYATLVDLWTLQHSLDDASAASSAISTEIDKLIPDSIIPLKDKEAVLSRRLASIQKQTRTALEKTKQIQDLASQKRNNDTSINSILGQSISAARSVDQDMTVRPRPQDSVEEEPGVTKEQSRLASELLQIFPIDLVEDSKFHFTIRGLALPSVFAINHYDPVQVGAALGFVAQVVVLLSRYLDVALPYPITVYGSQSFIADNISSIKHGSNKFPLWTRGALLYRVEYALYLLHKDIEQLMNAMNLAVADLKQTLANLKNLLLVVSHK